MYKSYRKCTGVKKELSSTKRTWRVERRRVKEHNKAKMEATLIVPVACTLSLSDFNEKKEREEEEDAKNDEIRSF